jgi:hypothetical protein
MGRATSAFPGPGDKQAGMQPSGLYEAAGRERVPGIGILERCQ